MQESWWRGWDGSCCSIRLNKLCKDLCNEALSRLGSDNNSSGSCVCDRRPSGQLGFSTWAVMVRPRLMYYKFPVTLESSLWAIV